MAHNFSIITLSCYNYLFFLFLILFISYFLYFLVLWFIFFFLFYIGSDSLVDESAIIKNRCYFLKLNNRNNILQLTQPTTQEELPPKLERAASDITVLSQQSISSQPLTQNSNIHTTNRSRHKAKEEVMENKILTNVNELLSDAKNPPCLT